MNCKQGDRFIVVKGRNSGKIGTCLRLIEDGELCILNFAETTVWECDIDIEWHLGNGKYRKMKYVPDRIILPLRDTDEEDEMLRVVGKPTVVGKPKEKENIE